MLTTSQIQPTSGAIKPEFLPLPRPGTVCPVCGLGRSFLYQLINDGRIQSVSLRQRGKARGKRLIVADSVLEYLRSQIQAARKDGAA
jgi:hypothetical protein